MTKQGAEATAGLGAETALSRPSPSLAKRSTPAGLAMVTLGLFHDSELDHPQKLKLAALRADVVSGERAMGAEIVSPRDAYRSGAADARDSEGLGAKMDERQHELVDRALTGALELGATLSPVQRLAFVTRANDKARSARRLAAKLASDGIGGGHGDDPIELAQYRATILEELARPVPDAGKVRTLGSAFVVAHARANSAAILVPTRAIANTSVLQELP